MRRGTAVVAGLVHDGLGLGEAARGYADALAAAGWEARQFQVALPSRASRSGGDPGPSGRSEVREASVDDEVDVLVVCLNPPELEELLVAGIVLPAARHVVGVWSWEADPAPAWWLRLAGHFDELWCYSTYVERVLRPIADRAGVPLRVVPPPVRVERPAMASADREDTFLCVADVASSLGRKNPAGVIDAFTDAFADGAGPRLIVKVWGAEHDAAAAETLRSKVAALGRSDVVLLEDWLDRREFLDLLASAGALISLHRSEGFGLPIFEAMALGVPVVASAATGPMDLLDEDVALLVEAEEVTIAAAETAYAPSRTWYEPSRSDAAVQLRRLWEGRAEARERAERGRQRVQRILSTSAVGGLVDERLRPHLARDRPPRRLAATTVSVVLHAVEPWPALRGVLERLREEAASVGGMVIVGVTDEQCLPASELGPQVRRIVAGSRSPFALRAAALEAADGGLIVVTEDHAWPRPGWLRAYRDAHRAKGAALLAGPIGNGSPGTRADWANYLVNFSPFAPPLAEAPLDRCPTIANCAVDRHAFDGGRADGRALSPEWFERELVPHLHHTQGTVLVPDAIVDHTQHFPLWRHLSNHFRDCRCAGAHTAALWPEATLPLRHRPLRQQATATLHEVTRAVATRPDLHAPHAGAAWPLRLLVLARAVALAAGARWGAGRAAEGLD